MNEINEITRKKLIEYGETHDKLMREKYEGWDDMDALERTQAMTFDEKKKLMVEISHILDGSESEIDEQRA